MVSKNLCLNVNVTVMEEGSAARIALKKPNTNPTKEYLSSLVQQQKSHNSKIYLLAVPCFNLACCNCYSGISAVVYEILLKMLSFFKMSFLNQHRFIISFFFKQAFCNICIDFNLYVFIF